MLEVELKELFELCKKCNTTGNLMNHTPAKFPRVGVAGGGGGQMPCPECEGDGVIFTSAGEVIRDFVVYLKHRGRI